MDLQDFMLPATEEMAGIGVLLLLTYFARTNTEARILLIAALGTAAVHIRLYAVREYGRVIHEFDPWFNFRATEYLVDNGVYKFYNWFDSMSWYPLGRHIGHTIYPGICYTGAAIFKVLEAAGAGISLNDVCVFLPAYFSVVTCLFTYLIGKEATEKPLVGVAACAIMAVIPSHIMRSVAGSLDNEAVGVPAIAATFFFWVRSLRDKESWLFGVLAGLSYVYLVYCWGGYIFVLNMIAAHAGFLCASGHFTVTLQKSYTVFYIIGTAGALTLPIVDEKPLRDMEHLAAMVAFFGLHYFGVLELFRLGYVPGFKKMKKAQFHQFRLRACAVTGVVVVLVGGSVLPEGLIGPLSARVRGLFVAHTKTGNPLVDSVAEHQATSPAMYQVYFHWIFYLFPVGAMYLVTQVTHVSKALGWGKCSRDEAKYFVLCLTAVAYYFSQRMSRLVLLFALPASICAGVAVGMALDWACCQLSPEPQADDQKDDSEEDDAPKAEAKVAAKDAASGEEETKRKKLPKKKQALAVGGAGGIKAVVGLLIFATVGASGLIFFKHCHSLAVRMSDPQIMSTAYTKSGEAVILDDYREAYWWLRDNTPEDARVLSWWDYGYQINGLANRTTLADGNTWNHEHIALIGKCLMSPEEEGWKIIRHLADYVLVWSSQHIGTGGGDDLMKCPHMARIGGSVFRDLDPAKYYINKQGISQAIFDSVLFKLHSFRLSESVPELSHFEEAYTSSHNMVRIYSVKDIDEESREYCKENRGYPPALKSVLSKAVAFDQQAHWGQAR